MERHTVRRFSLLMGLAMAIALVGGLVLSSGVWAQVPTVRVGSLTAGIGLAGTVDLEALDIGPPGLGAWTVDVAYDPAVVSVVSCAGEHGGLCNAAFAENTVRVTGVDIFGLEGDVMLATIEFACQAVGEAALVLTLDVLADATLGDPQPIAAATVNGSVTCTQEAPPTPTPSPEEIPGDVDCDGIVSAIDAALILQLEAELLDTLPCPENGDLNGDGVTNAIDAALILQQTAGLLG